MQQVHNQLNKLQSYSLPGNRYIDLTLGPSGSTYTAPADGWFICSGNNGYSVLQKTSDLMTSVSQALPGNWFGAHTYIPVKKGGSGFCLSLQFN